MMSKTCCPKVLACPDRIQMFEANREENNRLENVAVAMHCNLRPPDTESVIFRFKCDAGAKFKVGQPMSRSFIVFHCLYLT